MYQVGDLGLFFLVQFGTDEDDIHLEFGLYENVLGFVGLVDIRRCFPATVLVPDRIARVGFTAVYQSVVIAVLVQWISTGGFLGFPGSGSGFHVVRKPVAVSVPVVGVGTDGIFVIVG